MEFPAWIFFSFWSINGAVTMFLGLQAFDRTNLHELVSPIVIAIFKHALVISFCHSTTCAFIFRPRLTISVEKYYLWPLFTASPVFFYLVAGEHLAWYCFPVYAVINQCGLRYLFIPRSYGIGMGTGEFDYLLSTALALFFVIFVWPFTRSEEGDEPIFSYWCLFMGNCLILLQTDWTTTFGDFIGLLTHFAAVAAVLFFGRKTTYFPILVLPAAFLTVAVRAALIGDERFRNRFPVATVQGNRRLRDLKKTVQRHGKMIEFAIGMFGTILFQNFFRLTSFDHVVAFLYFAAVWLSNLGLMMCSRDLGILNFLLGNVVIGCTVSQFGLRRTTWIAYGASLLLYLVRLMLESLALVEGADNEAVITWRDAPSAQSHDVDESGEEEVQGLSVAVVSE